MATEIDFWRTKSGLSSVESIANYKHHTLKTLNGGVTDSIDSLFQKVYGKNELGYWRDLAGDQTLSLNDAKSKYLATWTPTPPAVVQNAQVVIAGATSRTVTLGQASVAGNTLVAVIEHQSITVAQLTVTDSAGNIYTKIADTSDQASTGQYRAGIYVSLGNTGGSDGGKTKSATTVTFTSSVSNPLGGTVIELSNANTIRSAVAAFDSTSSTQSKQTATTPVASTDIVIGLLSYFNAANVATAAAPFTQLTGNGVSTTRMEVAYWLATAAGAAGPAWTIPNPGSTNGTATVAIGN